jgi:hypothetical protein
MRTPGPSARGQSAQVDSETLVNQPFESAPIQIYGRLDARNRAQYSLRGLRSEVIVAHTATISCIPGQAFQP